MLRRVKKDVVSELTGKTEITVHCKLSSRQQAFYRAIRDKISLAELFDSSRGHLNEKKILNLMNIVIQLRKVIDLFLYCSFVLHHLIILWGTFHTSFIFSIVFFHQVLLFLLLENARCATIQSCLREMKELLISILERFQTHFYLLPSGSWRMYSILAVEVLLHTRYSLDHFMLLVWYYYCLYVHRKLSDSMQSFNGIVHRQPLELVKNFHLYTSSVTY